MLLQNKNPFRKIKNVLLTLPFLSPHSNTTPFFKLSSNNVFDIYVKSLASNKQNTVFYGMKIVNKIIKRHGCLKSAKRGSFLFLFLFLFCFVFSLGWGKCLWEFHTSNCTEITCTVELWALFVQKNRPNCKTSASFVFQGEIVKYLYFESNYI